METQLSAFVVVTATRFKGSFGSKYESNLKTGIVTHSPLHSFHFKVEFSVSWLSPQLGHGLEDMQVHKIKQRMRLICVHTCNWGSLSYKSTGQTGCRLLSTTHTVQDIQNTLRLCWTFFVQGVIVSSHFALSSIISRVQFVDSFFHPQTSKARQYLYQV